LLLIAQPKSASTSLLKTLAKIMKINFQNGLGKDIGWKYCPGYQEIQKYHDTTIQRSYEFLKKWIITRQTIYKEHILPIEKHLQYIKQINCKILIVLRNPVDSIDNYRRLYKKYLDRQIEEKEIDELMPYRFNNINFDLLLEDVELFNKKWRDFKYNKKLIITFEELILNYKKTIITILSHFKFRVPKKIIPLMKAKGNHGYSTYTGIGEKRLKSEL